MAAATAVSPAAPVTTSDWELATFTSTFSRAILRSSTDEHRGRLTNRTWLVPADLYTLAANSRLTSSLPEASVSSS